MSQSQSRGAQISETGSSLSPAFGRVGMKGGTRKGESLLGKKRKGDGHEAEGSHEKRGKGGLDPDSFSEGVVENFLKMNFPKTGCVCSDSD